MAKIIVKYHYYPSGSKKSMGGYAKYIATREGVEKPKTYADYIATRPRSDGLFSDQNKQFNLDQVSKELNNHKGNVWTFIISLRREDAERLGYNTADAWQTLIRSQVDSISERMKIPQNNLNWYAAFHNEGNHPHVHMIVYSSNEKEGYITEKGLMKLKSDFGKQIFKDDLYSVYKKQTEYRDDLKEMAKQRSQEIVANMHNDPGNINSNIEKMLKTLSERLSKTTGKKVYGYLSASNKALVDDIVKELSKDPKIVELYELWYQQKENTIAIYTDTMPERIELWANPEFKSIRNMVIKTALLSENTLQSFKNETTNHFYTFDLLCNMANIIQNKIDEKDYKNVDIDTKQKHKTMEKREAHGLHY